MQVRRVVMADVAARGGVSVMTVSRVLNGFDGVADPTRRRVEKAVAELGYQADTAARCWPGVGRGRSESWRSKQTSSVPRRCCSGSTTRLVRPAIS